MQKCQTRIDGFDEKILIPVCTWPCVQYGQEVDRAGPQLEIGPQSLDDGIRGVVPSMNKSSGNDILDTLATLPPLLPTMLDQWSFTSQRRGKQREH